METNRRSWIKQIGLGLAGIGLTNFKSFSAPSLQSHLASDEIPVILRSNENPYGPSPLARKAFADNVSLSNRYHWDVAPRLIAALANKNDVRDENILLGAGSTEILDLVAKLAGSNKGSYIIADPSYDYWTATLDNLGLTKIKVPLTADKIIDPDALSTAVRPDTKLIYLCNPNNPTGTICRRDDLVKFISAVSKDIIILVDEAYLDFTSEQSLCNLIHDFPNLIIAKTFSKIYGLAGARIGYAIADAEMINSLSKLQSNTNNSVSVLSKLAAMASLKDDQFVSNCYALNEKARAYTIAELEQLSCKCIASHTNFIYFSLADYPMDYFKRLEGHHIQGTRIYEKQGSWTRITVGRMEEMKQFIKALQ